MNVKFLARNISVAIMVDLVLFSTFLLLGCFTETSAQTIVGTSGTLQQLTANNASDTPAINGDGQKIAYRTSAFDVYLMNSDGTGQKKLASNIDSSGGGPFISNGGSKIVFTTGFFGGNGTYVVNSDGSGLTRVGDRSLNTQDPAISGDGSKVAYLTSAALVSGVNGGVFLVNSDGGGRRLLHDSSIGTSVSLSYNGSKAAFSFLSGNNLTIFVVNADGSGLRQLLDASSNSEYPSISGDGSKVAFFSNMNSAVGVYGLFVVNSDGTHLQKLAANVTSIRKPALSGDGSTIAFVAHDSNQRDQVFTVKSDGTGLKQLTNYTTVNFGVTFSDPSISFDGNKVAFAATIGSPNIFLSTQAQPSPSSSPSPTATPTASPSLSPSSTPASPAPSASTNPTQSPTTTLSPAPSSSNNPETPNPSSTPAATSNLNPTPAAQSTPTSHPPEGSQTPSPTRSSTPAGQVLSPTPYSTSTPVEVSTGQDLLVIYAVLVLVVILVVASAYLGYNRIKGGKRQEASSQSLQTTTKSEG